MSRLLAEIERFITYWKRLEQLVPMLKTLYRELSYERPIISSIAPLASALTLLELAPLMLHHVKKVRLFEGADIWLGNNIIVQLSERKPDLVSTVPVVFVTVLVPEHEAIKLIRRYYGDKAEDILREYKDYLVDTGITAEVIRGDLESGQFDLAGTGVILDVTGVAQIIPIDVSIVLEEFKKRLSPEQYSLVNMLVGRYFAHFNELLQRE